MRNSSILVLLAIPFAVEGQSMIALPNYPIVVEHRNFNITEVIDDRLDISRVGIVRSGTTGKKEVALMKRGLAGSIQAQLAADLPTLEDAYPVSLKIKRFGVMEQMSRQTGRVIRKGSLVAEFAFYLMSEAGYQEIFTQQYRPEFRIDSDATNRFGQLMHIVLTRSLNELAASDWRSKLKQIPVLSAEEAKQTDSLPSILLTETYVKGIYRTFEEYRENKPSLTQINVIWKDAGRLVDDVYYTDENNQEKKVRDEDDFWGFSDGTRTFIKIDSKFSELYSTSKGAYFMAGNPKGTNGKIVQGWVTAGVIGGAAAGSFSRKQGVFVVDMDTGAFIQAR